MQASPAENDNKPDEVQKDSEGSTSPQRVIKITVNFNQHVGMSNYLPSTMEVNCIEYPRTATG